MAAPRMLVAAAAASAAVAALWPGQARGEQISYVGGHPIGVEAFCFIEAPHVHVYAPSGRAKVLYRTHEGVYYFVGDPVAFSYDGPKHAYYGHHPVHVTVMGGAGLPGAPVEYCYLDGPHYHGFAPPPGAHFTVKGDAYWYVGAYPPEYGKLKKRYVGINAYYRPLVYARPVVVVAPPVGYIGPVVDVSVVAPVPSAHVGAAVEAGVGVRAGVGVEVQVPQPVVEVELGLPSLFIGAGADVHHHHGVGGDKVKTKKLKRRGPRRPRRIRF